MVKHDSAKCNLAHSPGILCTSLDNRKSIEEGEGKIINRRQVQFVVTVEKGHFCALQWKMWTKENGRFAFSCNINFNFSAKCPGRCLPTT